jgi:hypothetical protein
MHPSWIGCAWSQRVPVVEHPAGQVAMAATRQTNVVYKNDQDEVNEQGLA